MTSIFKPRPITLKGDHVTLLPLSIAHLDSLFRAGAHEELWQYSTIPMQRPDDMRHYIEDAIRMQVDGAAIPFVVQVNKTGEIVGSTRFGNIAREHQRLEIGWTWITPKWQRSFVNTEAKYLLLQHAFETLQAIRVEFKVDAINTKSRNALDRIGAVEEGIMRHHVLLHTGRIRDTVILSILKHEWPSVKQKLESKLIRADGNDA